MMNKEELMASELLLDLGVSIPIRPLRFFNKKKKLKDIVIRRPYMGGLIRIANKFLKIGVTYEELKEYDMQQNLEFITMHGREVSEIVAVAILRGCFSYVLFHKIVSWYLRWRVHPVFLSEAFFQLVTHVDISPFKNIIKSAQKINLLKPKLSQKRNGS